MIHMYSSSTDSVEESVRWEIIIIPQQKSIVVSYYTKTEVDWLLLEVF